MSINRRSSSDDDESIKSGDNSNNNHPTRELKEDDQRHRRSNHRRLNDRRSNDRRSNDRRSNDRKSGQQRNYRHHSSNHAHSSSHRSKRTRLSSSEIRRPHHSHQSTTHTSSRHELPNRGRRTPLLIQPRGSRQYSSDTGGGPDMRGSIHRHSGTLLTFRREFLPGRIGESYIGSLSDEVQFSNISDAVIQVTSTTPHNYNATPPTNTTSSAVTPQEEVKPEPLNDDSETKAGGSNIPSNTPPTHSERFRRMDQAQSQSQNTRQTNVPETAGSAYSLNMGLPPYLFPALPIEIVDMVVPEDILRRFELYREQGYFDNLSLADYIKLKNLWFKYRRSH